MPPGPRRGRLELLGPANFGDTPRSLSRHVAPVREFMAKRNRVEEMECPYFPSLSLLLSPFAMCVRGRRRRVLGCVFLYLCLASPPFSLSPLFTSLLLLCAFFLPPWMSVCQSLRLSGYLSPHRDGNRWTHGDKLRRVDEGEWKRGLAVSVCRLMCIER